MRAYATFPADPLAADYRLRFIDPTTGTTENLLVASTSLEIGNRLEEQFLWRIQPLYGSTVGEWSTARTINVLPQTVAPAILVESEDRVEAGSGTTFDFGGTDIHIPAEQTFTVTNFGNALLDLAISGDAQITGTDANGFTLQPVSTTTLQPTESALLSITFLPQTTGYKTATLTLPSNDPNTPSFTLQLTGTATTGDATITSTITGGSWYNPTTWLEGRTPNADDIVRIIGPVTTTSQDPTIAGLLIAETGSLTGGTIGYSIFTVKGLFHNLGRIEGDIESSRSYGILLDLYGDVINHGQLITSSIDINGDSDREIAGEFPVGVSIKGSFAMTGSPVFTGSSVNTGNNANTITTTEDTMITISSSSVGNLNFGEGASLILDGDQTINGDISAKHITFQNGAKTIYDATRVYGDVHILAEAKVWDRTKSGGVRGYMFIYGNLINEGHITDNPGDYYATLRSMNLYVFGDIINNGTWDNTSTQIFWDPITEATEYEFVITSDVSNWPAAESRTSPWNVSVKDKLASQWTWRMRGLVNGEWTVWKEYTINAPEAVPTLSFSAEADFADESGTPHGIDKPNAKATANEEEITFKVVYTDESAPENVSVKLLVEEQIDFSNPQYTNRVFVTRSTIDKPTVTEVTDENGLPQYLLGPAIPSQNQVKFESDVPKKKMAVELVAFGNGDSAIDVRLDAFNASDNIVATTTNTFGILQGDDRGRGIFSVQSNNSDIESVILTVRDNAGTSVLVDSFSMLEEKNMSGSVNATSGTYSYTGKSPQGKYHYWFESTNGSQAARLPVAEVEYDGPVIGNQNNDIDYLTFETGYSNVVFLPGITGSKLSEADPATCQTWNCAEEIWFPSVHPRNFESRIESIIEKLFLDSNGKSNNKNIFTTEVFDEADLSLWATGVETVNFYKTFLSDIATMKEEGKINDWLPIPYDWRLDFDDIIDDGELVGENLYYARESQQQYILNKFHELADSSANGKITIVAHSMGGLLSKKAISKLDDKSIIENLVLVASPQLGTPKAAVELLHGEDKHVLQDWKIDLLINAQKVREIGRNMPSSYALLPFREYFESVKQFHSSEPDDKSPAIVIAFDEASFDEAMNEYLLHTSLGYEIPSGSDLEYIHELYTSYGSTVDTYQEFKDYMLSANDFVARNALPKDETRFPFILNPNLFLNAENSHNQTLDNWNFVYEDNQPVDPVTQEQREPEFKIIQIAGTGVNTVRGIEYAVKSKKQTIIASPLSIHTLDHQPLYTFDGDGTVVLPSAVAMEGQNSDSSIAYDFITNNYVDTYFVNLYDYNDLFALNVDKSHGTIFEVPEVKDLIKNGILHAGFQESDYNYVYSEFPEYAEDEDEYIRLALHSPVSIDIYDEDGNHTGIVYDPENPDKEFYIAEEIPNSYYMQFGEGKYLGIPANAVYSIELQGLDEGTFTFEMTEVLGDEELQTKTYTDIPTNPNMMGVLTLSDLDSATNLQLDNDGDGVFEEELIPDEDQPDTKIFCAELDEPVTYTPTTLTPVDCGLTPVANQLRLVDSQCNPLENVRINLRRSNGSYLTYKRTDATGLVNFTDFDVSKNPSLFEVDFNGAKYRTIVDSFTTGTVVQTLPYRVTLKDSTCAAIESARINLRRENDSYVTYLRTGGDGNATFEILPEASMKLEVDYNGGKLRTEANTAATEVILGTEHYALLFTDSETNSIENARVNLRRENDSYITYAHTDENGTVGFEVLPTILLKHEVDYSGSKYKAEASSTHEQQIVQALTFGVLLTDSNGNPLENVRVNLRRANDSYITNTRTDSKGYGLFEVLPNAELKLEVDYNGAKYTTAAVTIAKATIEEMQLDATVEVSTNAISAVVTDSSGNPIENVRVNLRRENDSYITYTRTDSSGIANFETVPGAVMKLELDYNGGKYMTEAVTVDGNIEVPIATLLYAMVLTDSNGNAIENARINLRRSNDSYVTYTRTDNTGIATFEVVPNAELKFEVDYNGAKFSTDAIVVSEETIVEVQTIPYILNLAESNGEPLENIRINLRRSNDSYVTYVRTDTNGDAIFEVVPNAEMKFEVDYNGGKYSTDTQAITDATTVEVQTEPLMVLLTADAEVLANQRVDLLRSNDSYITYTKTDESGVAVFEVLPVAEHKMRVKYDGETWVSEVVVGNENVEHGF